MIDPTVIPFDSVQILTDYDPKNRLEAYYTALLAENEKVNLVSRETTKSNLQILAADSLLPFSYCKLDDIDNYLDIGSGGGFPALPILLTKNINQGYLFERRIKKAEALGRIVTSLEVKQAAPVSENFEDCSFNGKIDLITLRLVKLTERMLKKISNLITDKSVFIYYSTPSINLEKFKLSGHSYRYQSGSSDRFKSFTIIRKK